MKKRIRWTHMAYSNTTHKMVKLHDGDIVTLVKQGKERSVVRFKDEQFTIDNSELV